MLKKIHKLELFHVQPNGQWRITTIISEHGLVENIESLQDTKNWHEDQSTIANKYTLQKAEHTVKHIWEPSL